MKEILTIILLLITIQGKAQNFMTQPYFSPSNDELYGFYISNDTLFKVRVFNIYQLENDDNVVVNKFKIHSDRSIDQNYNSIQLESLDSIPLTDNPYPKARYMLWIYELDSAHNIYVVHNSPRMEKALIEKYKIDDLKISKKFILPLYSMSNIEKLSRSKNIETLSDAKFIHDQFTESKYASIIKEYFETELSKYDFYGTYISSVLINMICIDNNYNPFGAGYAINTLMKNQFSETEKEKMVKNFYLQLYSK